MIKFTPHEDYYQALITWDIMGPTRLMDKEAYMVFVLIDPDRTPQVPRTTNTTGGANSSATNASLETGSNMTHYMGLFYYVTVYQVSFQLVICGMRSGPSNTVILGTCTTIILRERFSLER